MIIHGKIDNLVLELLLSGQVHPCTLEKTNLVLKLLFLDQFRPSSELDVQVGIQLSQPHLKCLMCPSFHSAQQLAHLNVLTWNQVSRTETSSS
jgi:hypothetical protein